jgi:cyclohexanecarboxyl-CoA dehydrogenase
VGVAFSEEQLAIRETAERFSQTQLAPTFQTLDAEGRLDRDALVQMGDLGLLGASLPEALGGLDAGSVTTGIIIEAVSEADSNVAYVLLTAALCGSIVHDHGSEALARKVVPPVAGGRRIIAIGLTEPRGGSDAANLQLRADPVDGGYRLNGEKTSISLAEQADDIVLFARTGSPDSGARGVSAFYVDLHNEAIARSSFNDLGARAVGRGSLHFDNVFVPEENLLGEENAGFRQVMQGFDYSRALIGLQCLGAAAASLTETWAYVQEREAFDLKLAQYQGVTFPLAEHETFVKACRLLCYETLSLRDQGLPHTSEAAMVKWWAPKLSCEAIQQCLLSHGHSGYSLDLPHQQRLRDILGLQIGDGTAQIMKLIIAREKVGRIAVQYQN